MESHGVLAVNQRQGWDKSALHVGMCELGGMVFISHVSKYNCPIGEELYGTSRNYILQSHCILAIQLL